MESYNCGKRFLINKDEVNEFKDQALPISETFFIEMKEKILHRDTPNAVHQKKTEKHNF